MRRNRFFLILFLVLPSFIYAQGCSQVNTDGFGDSNNEATTCMSVYKGCLYIGTASVTGTEVWLYNGTTWTQVNIDGFGDSNNGQAQGMVVYNDLLYVGTSSDTGGEVWRTGGVGGPPYTDWEQVNTDGFGHSYEQEGLFLIVYNNHLYVGSQSNFTSCIVWKTAAAGPPPFSDWEQVITPGFGDTNNVVAAGMGVYNNSLYVGTGNGITGTEIWKYSIKKAIPSIPVLLLED